jgi:AraC-like DNA-binding protein
VNGVGRAAPRPVFMIGVETSLYSAAFALCLFSAGLVRGHTSERRRRSVYFTAFLAIEALIFVSELLMVLPATPLKNVWLCARIGLSLFIAPCLWLVMREGVEGVRPRLTDLGRWSWVAVTTGIAVLIPLGSAAHLGTSYENPAKPVSGLYSMVIHTGILFCSGIFAVQVPWYVSRCRRILLSRAGAPRWLQWPLIVVSATWLLGLLRAALCISHVAWRLDVVFTTIDVSVTVGALYVIVRQITLQESAPSTPAPKYARSNLDAATVARIRRKLESALSSTEICGDSLLNLRSLSRTIGEKAHYVSQVINQELGTNFYELVNLHRIEEAKKRLKESSEATILEIALAVGFNSKSTFNTAFRRLTGKTPSEFRSNRAKVSGEAFEPTGSDEQK